MESLHLFLNIFSGLGHKVINVLSSVWGWLISGIIFCFSYLVTGREALYAYILAAILIDMAWGIGSSLSQKKFLLSKLIPKTAMKLAIYFSVFSMIVLSEMALPGDTFIASAIGASVLCGAELWSVFGHILIVKPNTPVIRIFQKQLAGEMGKKLGMTEDEVIAYLNNK